MSEFVNTIDLLGDEAVACSIVDGSITEFNDDVMTQVAYGGFGACKALERVSLPNVTTVSSYAFSEAPLKYVDLPLLRTVSENAFSSCKQLTDVFLPVLGAVGSRMFSSCSSLKNVNLPVATTAYKYAFSDCSALETIIVPNMTSIGAYAFYSCGNLKNVSFPSVQNVSNDAFYNCYRLWCADFPVLTALSTETFKGCSQLNTLVLRNPTMCTLGNVNVFNGTPFASGGTGGTVYVPQALISEYQNATNWSTLYAQGTCNFVAIEGSEYE